jgi:hypothetical protein
MSLILGNKIVEVADGFVNIGIPRIGVLLTENLPEATSKIVAGTAEGTVQTGQRLSVVFEHAAEAAMRSADGLSKAASGSAETWERLGVRFSKSVREVQESIGKSNITNKYFIGFDGMFFF